MTDAKLAYQLGCRDFGYNPESKSAGVWWQRSPGIRDRWERVVAHLRELEQSEVARLTVQLDAISGVVR